VCRGPVAANTHYLNASARGLAAKLTTKEVPASLLLSCFAASLAADGGAQAQVLAPTQTGAGAPVYYKPAPLKTESVQADVCIYGGNSAGVAAALQLARLGTKSVILEPSWHLGGLSAGGLGETDIGNKAAIGGLSHEFYKRVGRKHGVDEEWRFEPRVAESVFRDMVQEAQAPVHFGQFLQSVRKEGGRIVSVTTQSGLTVRAKMFIDATYEGDLMAKSGVRYHVGREDNAVFGERINGVQVHKAHQFDLPVDPYVTEGNPASGLLPGINPGDPGLIGNADKRVQAYNFRLCLTNDPANRIPFEKPANYDPREYVLLARYLRAGWPESEVFRKFDPIRNSFIASSGAASLERAEPLQAADVTNMKGFVVKLRNAGGPFTKYLKEKFSPALRSQLDAFKDSDSPSPQLQAALLDELNRLVRSEAFYTPERFAKVALSEPLRAQAGQNLQDEERLRLNRALLLAAYPDEIGTRKYLKVDKNNHGAVSTDFIGRNYDYPEADYATRERIFQAHVTYQKGLLWFLGNDPSVPAPIRSRWSQWGLARDEFTETGGWPHQLYVREARRMVSDYVMTEHDCRGQKVAIDPVGLAAYTMDSHNTQRFVKDGRVWNEGDVQERGFPPYPISYRSIVPRKSECENLLVPVCLSTSHIAYGSIRMEPVFMILAQSAAYAAHLSIDTNRAVQDLPYQQLQVLLQQGGQILSWSANTTATKNTG
jgi:hypothetical protein